MRSPRRELMASRIEETRVMLIGDLFVEVFGA
jgi:hypothetical protein